MTAVRRILVAVDFSPITGPVLEHAVLMAEAWRAEVEVVHVLWEPPPYVGLDALMLRLPQYDEPLADHLRKRAEVSMDAALAMLPRPWPVRMQRRILFGSPASTIVDLARDEDFDLIIMGTHGRSGLARAMVGSVAEAVSADAPCPVITLRHPATTAQPIDFEHAVIGRQA